MTDDPRTTDLPRDHELPSPRHEPGATPWIVFIIGVAFLLLLFVALALIASPPNELASP
jgi:hypothetical protein